MDDSPKKAAVKLTSFLVLLLAITSFTWSIGAIGKGIWQLSQSKIQIAKNQASIPNFARVPNITPGVFNYGGSTAWASLRLAVDSVIQSERPEVQFRYVRVQSQDEPPGSSPGIKMLLEGQLDFVQSSHPLRPEEYRLAEQKGIKLQQVPVAVDSVALAVHPNLDISGLTLSQLKGIYTGKISNWREIGGRNLPITPYASPASTGKIVDFIDSKIFPDRETGSNVKLVPTATQALRQLADNPGGIYFDSAPAIVTECTIKPLSIGEQMNDLVAPYQPPLVPASECPQKRNQLNAKALRTAQYPLTHYLYVVFRQGEEGSEIGLAYANLLLTPQGQKLISNAGFIPLD